MRLSDFINSGPRVFFLLAVIYVFGFFSHAVCLKKTVYGDGIFYYSWLHSVTVDRDIDFSDEYQQFRVEQPRTKNGTYGNKYSIGPAVLWFSNYLLVHRIVRGNGYELPYQLTVGLTSVFYALIGLLLLYRLLVYRFSRTVAGLATLAMAGATNLLFYGSVDPVNSHALSFFAVSLFLLLLFQEKQNWIALGVCLGLIAIIRPQDAIVGILILPFLNTHTITKSFARFALGLIPLLFLQFFLWRLLYGGWIVSPYLTGHEGFAFLQPHVIAVLFDFRFGLITYTPVLLMAAAGFIFKWNYQTKIKTAIIASVVGQIYHISVWSTWSQGATYGVRMFVGMLPLLSIPLAVCLLRLHNLLKQSHHILILFISALSLINVSMILWVLIRNY